MISELFSQLKRLFGLTVYLPLMNFLNDEYSIRRPKVSKHIFMVITVQLCMSLKRQFFRYVKEWLCCVACGGIIEMDKSGERFWLTKENADVLCGPNASYMIPMISTFFQFTHLMPQLQEVFKRSGPYGDFSIVKHLYFVVI